MVAQGQVKPVEAKVEAISHFPVPSCKRQLMRFLYDWRLQEIL